MTGRECLTILDGIEDIVFATVDEKGKTQIGVLDALYIDEEGVLFFCALKREKFCKELLKNGHVAITGMDDDFQMIRVTGLAKSLGETRKKEYLDLILGEKQSRIHLCADEDKEPLEIFCVRRGHVDFFDMQDGGARESFDLGDFQETEGFYISALCIGCGKCREACPQNCIEEGIPYQIEEDKCDNCGKCYVACPVCAILKKGAREAERAEEEYGEEERGVKECAKEES